MKTLLSILLGVVFCSPLVAGDDVKKLRETFDAKSAAAMRPIREWYSQELARLEKVLTAGGKLDDALGVRNERSMLLLTSTDWVWDAGKAGVTKISFSPDGTGVHYYKLEKFSWTFDNWKVTLRYTDGRTAVLDFDQKGLSYTGQSFDNKPVKGQPVK